MMQRVSCTIAVGGDIRNTVVRGPLDLVTVPEMHVLQMVHGAGAISEIEVVDEIDREVGAEKRRLMNIYPGQIVDQLFPGTRPPMETHIPGAKTPGKAAAKKTTSKKADVSENKEDTPFDDSAE
jgi:hypothetical protein